MYDVLTALHLVNRSIESFGGDKERVALIGESSGSITVGFFCVSPLIKGLFSKVILESSTKVLLATNQLKQNLDLSQQIADAIDCESDARTIESDPESSVVGCLRSNQNINFSYFM
ncbi:hypothetical protein AVEN_116586-1 [Araneus ventricosus]|uniref:Carboxylic ester hydrolase n=1 Tax=Araneus ventricosus TaxID=182803 RepID=A0A4Y2HQE3_ARAVE|nr:hypothetical protein AVEN_116586-1 [Araneus ventricosus]